MTLIAVVFVSYLLFVMVVGAVASRYGRTMDGFFLADRGLGSWVTAISSVASSESGWLVIGLVGMAYQWGVQAVWTVPGVLLGYACNWFLVAPRLRAQSVALGAITIPGYLAARYGDRWNILRGLGILTILFCMMFYVSAQFTATGKAFQMAFGEPYGITYAQGVLIGGLITILYTLVGGFRAVSWTDLAQGLLMAFGLILLPIVVVASVGGPRALWNALEQSPVRVEAVMLVTAGPAAEQVGIAASKIKLAEGVTAARWQTLEGEYEFILEQDPPGARSEAPPSVPPADPPDGPAEVLINGERLEGLHVLTPGDVITTPTATWEYEKRVEMTGGAALVEPLGGATGMAMLGWVIGLLGIGFGYPGQPHVLTRYMAARSQRTLRRARLIAIVWGCVTLYGAVILGLAARIAAPHLVDPEQAYPSLATTHLPSILGGVLLAAIVSAMMSTADSQLLVVSSAVARDFIDRFLNIGARPSTVTLERSLVWISRASVLLIGLLALFLALGKVRVVFWFVLFAWSGLGAAFGPPILLGLFWRRVNLWGAVAGMATGLSVTILWKISWGAAVERATGLDLYELVPAFAMSLLMTWLVSILTPAMRTVPVDIDCAEDWGL
jgi:Na+/proline symporter